MKDLKETKLNLNIPSEEEQDFEKELDKYMKVYKDMSDVFIRHSLTIDEGIEFLELMWITSNEFKNQGLKTVQDMVNLEKD